MKYLLLSLLTIFTLTQTAFAQDEDIAVNLDNALAMSEKGDMPALEMAMTKVQTQVEKQAGEGNSDFKDKLLTAAGGLKNMIPMLSKGATKTTELQKIISTIKLLLGAHKLSNMLGGGGSLLTQAAGLKSNLGLMKMGMSVLGGKGDQMGSLIGSAMSGVAQLEKGGMGAKTAEPALKKQLGSILDLAKGAL
jgi:hypothetical protein